MYGISAAVDKMGTASQLQVCIVIRHLNQNVIKFNSGLKVEVCNFSKKVPNRCQCGYAWLADQKTDSVWCH